MKQHAVAVDQEMPRLAGDTGRDVRVDQIGHAKVGQQPVQRCQVATGLPLFGRNLLRVDPRGVGVHRASLFMVCFGHLARRHAGMLQQPPAAHHAQNALVVPALLWCFHQYTHRHTLA